MLSKLQLRPDRYGDANKMFTQGVDNFTGAMDRYAGRIKNRAVNELLGGFTPDVNDIQGSHNNLMQQLSSVGGISPTEALGLSSKAMAPAYADRDYGKGQWAVTTDDLGNVYKYNKNTGEIDTSGAMYNIYNSPKNTVLKSVVDRDPSGVETTRQVPVNKLTGQPVDVFDFSGPDGGYEQPDNTRIDANGNVIPMPVDTQGAVPTATTGGATGIKQPLQPAVTQKDKDFVDNYGSLNEDFGKLDDFMDFDKNPQNEDVFGPFDNYVDTTIGKLFKTDDSNKNAMITAMGAGMKQKIIKQFGSNPSDIDMAAVEAQIPLPTDSEAVAKAKLKRFKKMYQDGQGKQIIRLQNTNPSYIQPFFQKMHEDNNVPDGYKLQHNTETGEYRLIRS